MKKLIVAIASIFVATMAVAQSGYQIQPGDTLQVEVLEDPSLNRSVLVLPDGTISVRGQRSRQRPLGGRSG